MTHGIVFHADGERALQAIQTQLAEHGLSVVRSFDLRSALAAYPECPCPYHGMAQCTCQFVVLLIYGAAEYPTTLTLHSHADQTQAQIVPDLAAPSDPRQLDSLVAILINAALAVQGASARPLSADVEC